MPTPPDDATGGLEVPRIAWGWRVFDHPHPLVRELHTMPLYDTGLHAFDRACDCRPREDEPGAVIHNAFDGREAYETGKRKHH